MMRVVALAACIVGLMACKNVVDAADQPARIVDPTDASRAALQQALREALHTDVMVADDALTDSSMLIIERKIPQSISGSPAKGLNMDLKVHFRLLTNGTNCYL